MKIRDILRHKKTEKANDYRLLTEQERLVAAAAALNL